METEKTTDVSNYLKALKEANSDNEKFAALLMAESLVLRENVACFNNIVVTNPSEGDVDGEQLIDDTYDCFNSLSQSLTGLETMLAAGTVAAFCDVVVTQTFGYEKAHDLICCMVSCFGPDTWDGIEWSYHKYVNFLGKQFVEDEEETVEPPWIRPIVHGLDNIMRSKIGSEQREPALKLASMMVQVCGIYSLQPPYTPDFKLFLLTTHLSCVEVRMVLEDTDLTQANTKGRLLSSCYTYLENVINHLSSGPPLDLEERQVVQLHSAMVGAFGAVIHFLKRVALTPELQWNSILLATVRVLGAWMAEETAALREEIYDLIPFLVQLSNENIADATSSSNTEQPVKQDKSESDTVKNGERQSNGSETEGKVVEMDCDSGPESEKKSERDQNLEDITKPSIDVEMKSNGNTLDINTVIDTHTEVEGEPDKTGPETKSQGVSTDAENEDGYTDAMQERVRDANLEKDILTEEELQELHVKADILHYLLPGLCHLTAEEEPRKLLMESGALGDFLEPESIKKFYQSSVRFLSGAYTARHKKKGAVLDIVEPYKVVWEQISQTWFLSMQAFAACIPLYGELPGLILASSWLPSMIKVFQVKRVQQHIECFLNSCMTGGFGSIVTPCLIFTRNTNPKHFMKSLTI
ncbi:NCDN-like protein [Mya arenaria]|uniref:NCDN-like protein n=1 Tax=Mya arenaria TaxID=6604 RepID=A0ABY7EWM9_MYAAR|nr:NCDN-like protein [Mya arenaria]